MGRKKKKINKPWCWYCNREFEDEKILLQHQKAKHFKCHICHKKLFTGPGLSIHCMQVHKEQIDKVPNSMPNRSNIEIEIYGMEGIPDDDLKEHERQKLGKGNDDDEDEVPAKVAKTEPSNMLPKNASMPAAIPGMMPGQMYPGMPLRPGMMPPPNARMMGGPMPPMMGMGPMPPLGMPPPFMPPGMIGGPMMPPRGMMIPPMVTSASSSLQPPPKPLFPVSSTSSSVSPASAPVGADFKPLNSTSSTNSSVTVSAPPKPTFPAYGADKASDSPSTSENKSNATICAESTVKKTITTMTTAAGQRSRIIHPDEDISLEERRARLPKYLNSKGVGGTSSSAPNNMSGMNMRPVASPAMPPRGPPFTNRAPGMMYQQSPPMMQSPPARGQSVGNRMY